MGTPEATREPCPDRILDNIGGAFAMGAVGSSAFYFLKGLRNSPSGARFPGACQAVRMNSPRVGGGFAVWGGLFSTFDCGLVYLRQKEDPWNSIMAGAATGGLLQMRQGLPSAARSAAVGGVQLALIEGAGIMINKFAEQNQRVILEEPPPNLPALPGYPSHLPGQPGPEVALSTGSSSDSGSDSWVGGWFGGGKKKESQVPSSSGSETKVLESYDAPPVPSFEYY
ncbi:mitochondrial import inner membrane translocase subunit TIM17-2-like [Ziziphus jujuba]|uniref:Mitochondrial import inner membrane translocase subunit TIM17-2-like n=1 Tax=Ziziphus jujuba TaxID=326968 RepID=A0ABM3ZWJ4_ZIZJJ|nr:mitochondrial import inner membrane translocase subunit TIM17-2-like [Ziziphus jujuba]XP_060668844.1 mitochondrial import inner membrane translocase subunit TIM17-2-like [Ziziphus jujuba]